MFMTGLLALAILGAIVGFILGYASHFLKKNDNSVVDAVNDLLPQSQCGQCGYPGCRPYAEALVNGTTAFINKCVPGGEEVMLKIANTLGVEAQEMSLVDETTPIPKIAIIIEAECIGCTKCIKACPVDAIVGSKNLMHTVITDYCTGCELCVAPCPMDCIEMHLTTQTQQNWQWKLETIPFIYIEN